MPALRRTCCSPAEAPRAGQSRAGRDPACSEPPPAPAVCVCGGGCVRGGGGSPGPRAALRGRGAPQTRPRPLPPPARGGAAPRGVLRRGWSGAERSGAAGGAPSPHPPAPRPAEDGVHPGGCGAGRAEGAPGVSRVPAGGLAEALCRGTPGAVCGTGTGGACRVPCPRHPHPCSLPGAGAQLRANFWGGVPGEGAGADPRGERRAALGPLCSLLGGWGRGVRWPRVRGSPARARTRTARREEGAEPRGQTEMRWGLQRPRGVGGGRRPGLRRAPAFGVMDGTPPAPAA